jgi:hypothetical protein
MGAQYQNITADEWTTAGAAEETVNASLDGAAPAASIAVANGRDLFVEDFKVSTIDGAAVPLLVKVQQSNDNGASWFTVDTLALPAEGNVGESLKAPIRFRGNATGVLLRFRARTAAAGTLSLVISAWNQRTTGE